MGTNPEPLHARIRADVILQDVHIGDDAYIGLGSVVLKDVKKGTTVFGNPARVVPGNNKGGEKE